MKTIDDILAILKALRLNPVLEEFELHAAIAQALSDAGVAFEHEAKIASRCRIDFLTAEGVGIEVKKGKPTCHMLVEQIERYARCEQVIGVIAVVERNAAGWTALPEIIEGKPARYISLNRQWGIAL